MNIYAASCINICYNLIMKKYKCASFFAGVGGIDLGFEQTKHFDILYANEFDENPIKTYEKNFNFKVDCKDIKKVKPKDIPDIDILFGGFPCQPFSVAGYQHGLKDERGELFFELIRIIKAKKPKVVFLENVKNLVGHDNGRTFTKIIEALEKSGYHVKYQVLNGMYYGNVPQNRERIYIVAFRDKKTYEKFDFPKPTELTRLLSDVIEYNKKVDDKYYYTKDKYPNIIKEFNKIDLRSDTVYQWRRKYVRENKSNVCPTLTANMGEGGHNVPLVSTKYGIRKLTPKECFRLQGFPKDFVLPEIADVHLYKQAGNSVVVPVINKIANGIYSALISA